MLDTLKIYVRKQIPLNEVVEKLVQLEYKRYDSVNEEGDFSVKGDTLEIFPVNFTWPLRVEWEFDVVSKIYSFDKNFNRKIADYDFLIVIPFLKRYKRYSEDIPLDAVLRIKSGDYVVHINYGIGKFLGIKKIRVKDKEDYFFEIEYANKDKIYLPREDIHLIQKYVSFTLKPPRLSTLGSKEWYRTKKRVEEGVKNFARELLRIEAERQLQGGFKYSADTEWQKLFEASFLYQETEDQRKATEEVKKDMESARCMDRLICGDVGYGKTEVAMRAAFKAVMDSKQVAFLVPTTILAYQHYESLKKRIGNFPINVEMLSRFKSPAEQKEIVKRLKQGRIDIIVGTHRLLSSDIEFFDLGLLIVDEEQRFGVAHKERIKKLKVGIDVLTLTATPIPRTLYMGLIGIKDISIIKTPPQERLSIKTKVAEFSHQIIQEAINREVKRNGQVFFIHNRIETISRIERTLREILPSPVRIGVVHGRMSSGDIERTMLNFIDKNIDCLLSTAIVESGIDIPSANTIIVNDAHRFGLADLHQLRGRVGRYNIQAYAYFLIPPWNTLESEVQRRLKLLQEFSHLGAGFDVAMSDLELRGAGNILGPQQHGFIWMVGFDLYCRLLKQEIEYLKAYTNYKI
ncbi:MAG: transcription-repair coupling factor [Candidatus Omnitrophica bacterium]|nr:transcription-repair coupling factor [Candidatus Omnitrophota bacterium]MCM8826828.1 transcription-repair coupling factor [Candidatus Omnitrophota bacterium]